MICVICQDDKPDQSFHKNHNECRSCKLKRAFEERKLLNTRRKKRWHSCNDVKENSEFYHARNRPITICKICYSIQSRKKYDENKQLQDEINGLTKELARLTPYVDTE